MPSTPRRDAAPSRPRRRHPHRALATAAALAAALPWAAAAGAPMPDFDCLIEPAQVVEVRSPVVGLLQRVEARRGESIRRGQVLVTVESSVEQSAADAARARALAEGALRLARSKVQVTREKAQRMNDLADDDFISPQARADAVAEAQQAEAELKGAEENAQIARLEHRQSVDQLNRRVLRSPFNGVVVDQYLYPGALVEPSEGKKPILKIAETRPLKVHAIVPYRFFPDVKVGMPALVLPEKPFGGSFRTRVDVVDRVIDSAAGTFGVVLSLPNARDELPGGIRCKLQLSPP